MQTNLKANFYLDKENYSPLSHINFNSNIWMT